MVDTKSPGDKTLSVPTKTLTLKPRVETGTVRQSFSHGRTKQVVVEKRGKRRIPGEAPATETPAAEPPFAAALVNVAINGQVRPHRLNPCQQMRTAAAAHGPVLATAASARSTTPAAAMPADAAGRASSGPARNPSGSPATAG